MEKQIGEDVAMRPSSRPSLRTRGAALRRRQAEPSHVDYPTRIKRPRGVWWESGAERARARARALSPRRRGPTGRQVSCPSLTLPRKL